LLGTSAGTFWNQQGQTKIWSGVEGWLIPGQMKFAMPRLRSHCWGKGRRIQIAEQNEAERERRGAQIAAGHEVEVK